jgi:probable rRNA maturation factor
VRSKKVRVNLRNLQRRLKVDGRSFGAFLKAMAADAGRDGDFATFVLVSDAQMQALNRNFRGFDRPTDVLSFPVGDSAPPGEEPYLGDVVISAETAHRQALRRGSTLPRELRVLALHGYLHLQGYDHETDDGEMRRLEYRLRRKLGITRPIKAGPNSAKRKARKK